MNRKRQGFTLLELTIVLLLAAVLTAVLLPEMRGSWEGERLRSVSGRLVRAMHLAYSQSVSLRLAHQVRLDPSGNRFAVEEAASADSQVAPAALARDLAVGHGNLDQRVRVEIRPVSAAPDLEGQSEEERARPYPSSRVAAGTDAIAFYPDGTAEAKEIVLRDSAGFGLALRVNPVTARVRVITLERERPL